MNPDFLVKPIPGKGRGVFAGRAFLAGERLLSIEGEPASRRGPHTIQVGWGAHIKPTEPFLFTNHSCDPNAGIRADVAGRAGLYARRVIQAGEEITWDYAMSEAELAAMPCSCGASACRGVIEGGWDGLSEERRAAYRDWLMPYLRSPK